MAEHTVYIRVVAGSSPARGTVRLRERRLRLTDETEACAKAAQKLEGGWRYYYAQIASDRFCVFEVETLKPVKYLSDVREARFWVSQYESGIEGG